MQDGKFVLKSEYKPTGDQPAAIAALTDGILAGERAQTLVGVTGSGTPHAQVWVVYPCSVQVGAVTTDSYVWNSAGITAVSSTIPHAVHSLCCLPSTP